MEDQKPEEIRDSLIVVGPHLDLIISRDSIELEDEVMRLLKENGRMPVSSIWRKLRCHLWEVDAALRDLESRGLIVECEQDTQSRSIDRAGSAEFRRAVMENADEH